MATVTDMTLQQMSTTNPNPDTNPNSTNSNLKHCFSSLLRIQLAGNNVSEMTYSVSGGM